MGFSVIAASRGYSLVAVPRLLIVVASLFRVQVLGLEPGSRAQAQQLGT